MYWCSSLTLQNNTMKFIFEISWFMLLCYILFCAIYLFFLSLLDTTCLFSQLGFPTSLSIMCTWSLLLPFIFFLITKPLIEASLHHNFSIPLFANIFHSFYLPFKVADQNQTTHVQLNNSYFKYIVKTWIIWFWYIDPNQLLCVCANAWSANLHIEIVKIQICEWIYWPISFNIIIIIVFRKYVKVTLFLFF